jgi:hypothetical protein
MNQKLLPINFGLPFPVSFATCLLLMWFCGEISTWGQSFVQLPQFRQFQVNGSVMVPDGGSTYMGGVSGSALGSRQYGVLPFRPFANRTTGGGFSNSGVVTSVEVYSLREMEGQLMGQRSPEYLEQLALKSAAEDQRLEQQRLADQAKFREIGRKRADEKVERAKEDVRWARKFAAAGNHLAADMYYEQAIKSLPPDLAAVAKKEHRNYQVNRQE